MSNQKSSGSHEIDPLHNFFLKCTNEPYTSHRMPKSISKPKPIAKTQRISKPHKKMIYRSGNSPSYRASNTRNVPPFINLNFSHGSELKSQNSFLIIKMKTDPPKSKIVLRISEP